MASTAVVSLPPDASIPENVKALAKEHQARKTEFWFCPNPQRKSIFPMYLSYEDQLSPEGDWVYFQENEKKLIPANRRKSLRNIYVWSAENAELKPVRPEMLPPVPEEDPVPVRPALAFLPSNYAELLKRFKLEESPYWFVSNPSRAYPILFGPRDAWVIFKEEGKELVNKRKDLCHIYTWDAKEGFQPARPESTPADGTTPTGTALVLELEQIFTGLLGNLAGSVVSVEDELSLAVGLTKKMLNEAKKVDIIPTVKEEKLLRDALKIAQVPVDEKRAGIKATLAEVTAIFNLYEYHAKRKSLLPQAKPFVAQIEAGVDSLPEPKVHMLYWRTQKYGAEGLAEAFLQANSDKKECAEKIIIKTLLFDSLVIKDAKNTYKANPGADANNSIWLKAAFRVKKPGEKEDDRDITTYWFQDGVLLRAGHPHTVGVDYVYIKKEKLLEIFLCEKDLPKGTITFDIERNPQDNEDRKIEFAVGKRRIAQKLFTLVQNREVLLFRSLVGPQPLPEDVLGTPVYVIRTQTLYDEPITELDNANNVSVTDESLITLVQLSTGKDLEKEEESLSFTEFYYAYPFASLELAAADLASKLSVASSFFTA